MTSRSDARTLAILVGLFGLAGSLVLWAGRGLTFSADDWTFIQDRVTGGLDVFLEPHNEHLSVLPVAVYKALFATAGLDDHLAYRLVLLVAHLACAFLVYVYARRRLGEVAALLVLALILFLGQAWEVLFITIGVGYLGSLVTGVGALLMLDRRTTAGDIAASVLLLVGLSSSSIGVAFLAGAFAELVVRRSGWRRPWPVAVPAGVYAIWLLTYRTSPTRQIDIAHAPEFLGDVAASAMGGLTGVSLVSEHIRGGVLDPLIAVEHLLALGAGVGLAVLIWRRGVTPRVAMLVTTLLSFWVLLALFRSRGAEGFSAAVDPYSGRYIYPSVVLLLLLGVELARDMRPPEWAIWLAPVVVAAVAVANVIWLVVASNDRRAEASTTTAQLGALEIMRDAADPRYVPSRSLGARNIVAGPYLEAVDRLNSSPADTPDEIARKAERTRRAADRVLIGSQSLRWLHRVRPAGAPPRLERSTGAKTTAGRSCVSVRPVSRVATLTVKLTGAGITLPTRPQHPVEVRFRSFSSRFPQSPAGAVAKPVTIRPSLGRPDRPWHVQLLSGGSFLLCG